MGPAQPNVANRMYTGYRPCDRLKKGEKCFRAQKYNEGAFDEVFHEHVPSFRISQESSLEVLRSLSARYADWPGVYILDSHLNERGRNPLRHPALAHHVEYPEPGVVRFNVSNTQVTAWYDTVLSTESFRRVAAPNSALQPT